jgi:hypothetical protein
MLLRRLLPHHKGWLHAEPLRLRTRITYLRTPHAVRRASAKAEEKEAPERGTIPPTIIEKAHEDAKVQEDRPQQENHTDLRTGFFQQSFDPARTHQFDTFRLVSALQRAGYSHMQAVALMKCLRTVLVSGTEVAKSYYLSRGDLENVPLLQNKLNHRKHIFFAPQCLNFVRKSKPFDIMNQRPREPRSYNYKKDWTL